MTNILRRSRPGARRPAAAGILAVLTLAAGAAAGAQDAPPAVPVPGDYRIGAQDLLAVSVFELPELNQTVRVSDDGSITLAMLGKVDVAGLTPQDLEKRLVAALESKWLRSAHVSVFIQQYQKVAVLGAVARPGMYEIYGRTTLLQILSQAGGLTPAAMDEITIFRETSPGRKEKLAIDSRELFVKGNTALDVALQPRDVVSVPVDEVITVYVYGEVRTPGALQVKASKRLSLLQAVAQAGGTTEWASRGKVVVSRTDRATGKTVRIPASLDRIVAGRAADLVLRDGDVVTVPEHRIF